MTVGFCGRPNGGGHGANSPVSTDPNADLIGHRFPVDTGGEGTVTGTAPWSHDYVEVATGAGRTVRLAALLRRRRELIR